MAGTTFSSVGRYGVALVLAGAGILGAVKLLTERRVGEWTFCFLVLVAIFVGIWTAYSDRVKELTLGVGKLKMVLSEVQEAQRDVEERERKVREIAAVAADIVAHIAAFSGRIGERDTQRLNRLWLEKRFQRLSSLTDLTVGGAAWRFAEKVKALDEDDPKDRALLAKAWEEAYSEIRKELGE